MNNLKRFPTNKSIKIQEDQDQEDESFPYFDKSIILNPTQSKFSVLLVIPKVWKAISTKDNQGNECQVGSMEFNELLKLFDFEEKLYLDVFD